MLETIAKQVIAQGAPKLGAIIGTAIGGPAGTAIGGMAGKALEALADELLVEKADPAAINEAMRRQPDGGKAAAEAVEARLPDLMPIWREELAFAATAQNAEIEKGFHSWNARRSMAHYSAWGVAVIIVLAVVYSAFTTPAAVPPLMAVLGVWMPVLLGWIGVNSGGRALTDIVKASKGQG